MMGSAVLVGELIALSGSWPSYRALLGFPVAFLLTAATMALNDYYDRYIDSVNNPRRPIPSGAVSAPTALFCTFLFSAIGISISALVNLPALVIAAVSLVFMVYYNIMGKRTGFFGNIIVSACVSLPFIFGGYAVENMKPLLWIFASTAFLSNLGREVVKGVADVEGDRMHDVMTLAVLFGPRHASFVASALFTGAIGLSVLPQIFRLVSTYYLPAVLISDLGFASSILSFLKDCSTVNAKVVKNRILIWMALGLFAFLVGSHDPSVNIWAL
jgi:geranylgeranylglycerol-phosphate geranylgeranyltransferase